MSGQRISQPIASAIPSARSTASIIRRSLASAYSSDDSRRSGWDAGAALARPQATFLPTLRHPPGDSGFDPRGPYARHVLLAPVIAVVIPNGAIAGKSSTDCQDKTLDS